MVATTDNSTLMLSRGTRRVTFAELQAVPAPRPTETWYLLSHGRVLDSALEAINAKGFRVRRMDLGVSRDDAKFLGVLDLTSTIVEGLTLAVGVRSSIDKSLPAGLAGAPKVLAAWRRPPHEEFTPRTAWSLVNAFTEVAKGRFERNPTRASTATSG